MTFGTESGGLQRVTKGSLQKYNDAWDVFLLQDRTEEEILQFGRDLMTKYGLPVRF